MNCAGKDAQPCCGAESRLETRGNGQLHSLRGVHANLPELSPGWSSSDQLVSACITNQYTSLVDGRQTDGADLERSPIALVLRLLLELVDALLDLAAQLLVALHRLEEGAVGGDRSRHPGHRLRGPAPVSA